MLGAVHASVVGRGHRIRVPRAKSQLWSGMDCSLRYKRSISWMAGAGARERAGEGDLDTLLASRMGRRVRREWEMVDLTAVLIVRSILFTQHRV